MFVGMASSLQVQVPANGQNRGNPDSSRAEPQSKSREVPLASMPLGLDLEARFGGAGFDAELVRLLVPVCVCVCVFFPSPDLYPIPKQQTL